MNKSGKKKRVKDWAVMKGYLKMYLWLWCIVIYRKNYETNKDVVSAFTHQLKGNSSTDKSFSITRNGWRKNLKNYIVIPKGEEM